MMDRESADGKAPRPVARKPHIARRSNDRGTRGRMLPCHACEIGNKPC